MTSLFISYRRSDAAPHAGRLYDRLTARFGDDAVFMDVDDIEPGADFPQVIAQTLARSDVLLVVMGRGWVDARDGDGRRRLEDRADFVRQEIESAMRLGKRIVPLLVGGATMPAAPDLPPELAALPRYNALELSDARFDADFARLIECLETSGGRRAAAPQSTSAVGKGRGLLLAGAIGVVLLAVGGYWMAPMLAQVRGQAPVAGVVDGNWSATVTYGWGATHEERFVFTTRASEVLGAAGFLGVARPIVGGSLRDGQLAFSIRTQEVLGRDTRDLVHNYRGTLEGDSIRFVLITEGGNSPGPVEFIARRRP